MRNKRYPEELMIEAVKQVAGRGGSVADVAKRLGVTTHSFYVWIKKYVPDCVEYKAKSDEQALVLPRFLGQSIKSVLS